MKFRAWLLALILFVVTVTVLLGWGMSMTSPLSSEALSLEGLVVDGERLRSHLATLEYERYLDTDLARTRTYLTQQLHHYGLRVEREPFEGGINLIATRPGTNPLAGTLVVGAHYDTVQYSPGADDNASAVATALEVARLFAHYPTPTTLKVVFFDQEEIQPVGYGLLGSNAFVLQEENLRDLKGAVILEMLGFACYEPGCQQYPRGLALASMPDRGDFLSIIGNQEYPDLLMAFENTAEEVSAQALPVITLPVSLAAMPFLPDLFRSDHAPFWVKGVGAVMVTDTANFRNPNYHRATDTVDSLDLDFLTKAAQKVTSSVAKLLVE